MPASRAETAFTVSRPATQAKDAALFIEVQSGDDLAPLALERGMIVVRPDLTQTSPALRAHELHEIVARLRVAYAAHRVIGHAAAANIAVLMGAANDFDGLLLSDSAQPVVASKKTPRIIETWGSDLYWKSPVRIDAQGAAPQNLRRFFIAGAVADIASSNCLAMAPFASTQAVREKSGDTRLALIDRYGSRAYFVATMRVIADRLVKERLLLPRDADAYVAAAKTAPF